MYIIIANDMCIIATDTEENARKIIDIEYPKAYYGQYIRNPNLEIKEIDHELFSHHPEDVCVLVKMNGYSDEVHLDTPIFVSDKLSRVKEFVQKHYPDAPNNIDIELDEDYRGFYYDITFIPYRHYTDYLKPGVDVIVNGLQRIVIPKD